MDQASKGGVLPCPGPVAGGKVRVDVWQIAICRSVDVVVPRDRRAIISEPTLWELGRCVSRARKRDDRVSCDLCSKMRSSVVAMRGLGRWPRQNAPDPTGAKRLLLLISQSRAER